MCCTSCKSEENIKKNVIESIELYRKGHAVGSCTIKGSKNCFPKYGVYGYQKTQNLM
jgi:hypothetical protein